jgi:mRNA interferase RelE/StbE
MYRAEVYKQAARYHKKLDVKTKRRINLAIDEMIKNPFEGNHIKRLKGRLEGKYRYDIGNFRVIYCVDVDNKTIYVEAIGPRGDVYK